MKKNFHIIIISFIFSIILWITISLSNDFYATFKIPIHLVDFPNGYTTGSPLPETVSIKLKGKGWKLLAINLISEENYVIPVGKETGSRSVSISNFLTDNQWLSSDVEVINIYPNTLSFYVEKIASKKVPILPNLKFYFKNGYGLASPITVSPESTVVSGASSYIKDIKYVMTDNIEFDRLDNQTSRQVPLEYIQGMDYNEPTVTVALDVQKIIDKNFDGIPVKVLDVPRDRSVLLLPNRISVGVRGGIDILGRLDTSRFSAYINYDQVVSDTVGSLLPHVLIPDNTLLLFTKPERLRYIIKKFN